jgi:methyl-accepting chemotaxis protein
MTGNYDQNLANSRTKSIFDDYTGARCGSNTQSFLLQTYKRDTGEVMHDLSAPIYVNGKHWGGFRIGYQAQQ